MNISFALRSLVLMAILATVAVGCVPIQAPTPVPTEMDETVTGDTIEATFVCPDGTSLDTVFDNDAQTVTVTLPDGTVTLPQVESGSGARYSDGTTTFWNKGDEALVEVDDEIVYQNCVAQ